MSDPLVNAVEYKNRINFRINWNLGLYLLLGKKVTFFFLFFVHFVVCCSLKFLLLFNYSCLHFVPIPPPQPSWTQLPPPPPPSPLILSMCPYSSSWKPFSPLSIRLSPLAIVTLFLISMSLVIFCFFVLLIMFQLKVRSYGICPSLPGLFHLA